MLLALVGLLAAFVVGCGETPPPYAQSSPLRHQALTGWSVWACRSSQAFSDWWRGPSKRRLPACGRPYVIDKGLNGADMKTADQKSLTKIILGGVIERGRRSLKPPGDAAGDDCIVSMSMRLNANGLVDPDNASHNDYVLSALKR